MNKNILNLNNQVEFQGIRAESVILVPAPLCNGFSKSPPKSGRGQVGVKNIGAESGQGRGNSLTIFLFRL